MSVVPLPPTHKSRIIFAPMGSGKSWLIRKMIEDGCAPISLHSHIVGVVPTGGPKFADGTPVIIYDGDDLATAHGIKVRNDDQYTGSSRVPGVLMSLFGSTPGIVLFSGNPLRSYPDAIVLTDPEVVGTNLARRKVSGHWTPSHAQVMREHDAYNVAMNRIATRTAFRLPDAIDWAVSSLLELSETEARCGRLIVPMGRELPDPFVLLIAQSRGTLAYVIPGFDQYILRNEDIRLPSRKFGILLAPTGWTVDKFIEFFGCDPRDPPPVLRPYSAPNYTRFDLFPESEKLVRKFFLLAGDLEDDDEDSDDANPSHPAPAVPEPH